MRDNIESLIRREVSVVQRHLRDMSADLISVARGSDVRRRNYESGSMGRRLSKLNSPGTDGNAEVMGDGGRSRFRSRTMERDSSFGLKALRSFAVEQVGDGIRPRFQSEKDKVERILKRDWEDFVFQADGVSGGTLYGLQMASVLSLARDGGTLCHRQWRRVGDKDNLGYSLAVPLQLQNLEIDHLCLTLDGTRGTNGGLIANGIELNSAGRRVAYHIYTKHPGAVNTFGLGSSGFSLDSTPIPASEMTHAYLYNFARPGQMVDAPWLHAVIARLYDLDGWQDATMLSRRMSASVSAYVEGGDPLAPPDTVDGINPRQGSWATNGHLLDGHGYPIEQFEPGMVAYLPNGKSVNFPDQPTVPGHEETTRVTLREIAAGTGDSYENLSGDITGSNFISLRVGMLARYYLMRSIRNQVTIPMICRPHGLWFLEAEALARRYNPDRDRVSIEWIPMAREDADELMRQKILQHKIRNNMLPYNEALIGEGYDPEDMAIAIEKSNELRDRHGIVGDCDPRQQTAAGQPSNSKGFTGAKAVKDPVKKPVNAE